MPEDYLATYGTLAPGHANYHQLNGLEGEWTSGTVRGYLRQEGWGATMGYPGLVLDPRGLEIEVQLFRSVDLSAHWQRLDAFEGAGYSRTLVEVTTPGGQVRAWVYALAASTDGESA